MFSDGPAPRSGQLGGAALDGSVQKPLNTGKNVNESLYFGPTRLGNRERHPFAIASGRRPFTRLRAAAAFATESGVHEIQRLVDVAVFEAAEKQWLIGLESGFTQPSALRRLLQLPNSTVCLVDIHEILRTDNLTGSTFFHPKIYEFASLDTKETTIIATSANLTEGGLRGNVEQFLSWDGPLHQEVAKTLTSWWGKLWRPEWFATEEIVEAYAAKRPVIQPRTGAKLQGPQGPIVEIEPAASELRSAPAMWIEAVRPLEGGAKNQLELMLNAHTFFFPDLEHVPRDTPRSLVFVDDDGREFTNPNRQVLFNGPPLRAKGNFMWRVYLPTGREGLSGYQEGGVLIRFARTAERDRYRISFVPTGSADADTWYDQSSKVASVSGLPTRLMGWN